jgi:hypothetical protein
MLRLNKFTVTSYKEDVQDNYAQKKDVACTWFYKLDQDTSSY